MRPKAKAKIARATKVRDVVLRFMRKRARWERLANGPEVLVYQDQVFRIPSQSRRRCRRSYANSSTWVFSRRGFIVWNLGKGLR
jgi:hypothetical protein